MPENDNVICLKNQRVRIHQLGDEPSDAFEKAMEKLAAYEASKISIDEYCKAVGLLVSCAFGDTSGSRAAAGVLLSCHDAFEFHLDITELCVLDLDHYPAALKVIRGRVELGSDPHTMIENGNEIFCRICDLWSNLRIVERAKALEG